jgi:hypothetical protein
MVLAIICRHHSSVANKQTLFLRAESVGLAEGIVPDSAGRQVSDVRAEGSYLRRRGVSIEDYDTPGLQTEDGIADLGFAWMAWFIDPGQNCVAMMQLKNP